MRLRPEGRNGPLCSTVESALTYYDLRGRTWERQAYVKARPIAGDLALGKAFLDQLEPWVYRRYLSLADIAGIKGLKRRIEDGAPSSEDKRTDLKTGRGGIRDIEFVIQFLQLLNGGALPEVRTGNTLEAIVSLEESGCLTNQERSILDDNYCYLRRLEHRIQIMFDLQTPHLARRRRSAVAAGQADGLHGRQPPRAGGGLPTGTTASGPSGTARSSTTCCTTPSAATPSASPRSTW